MKIRKVNIPKLQWKQLRKLIYPLILLVMLFSIALPSAMPVEAVTPPTSTLNPNGDDASTLYLTQTGSGTHWSQVSDSSDATYVMSEASFFWEEDRYNLSDPGPALGPIVSVSVHIRVARAWVGDGLRSGAWPFIAVGGAHSYGTPVTIPDNDYLYSDYSSSTWTTNPVTSSAWTWSDLTDLQAGIALRASGTSGISNCQTRCSKLWVVVNYDPPFDISPTTLTTSEGGSPVSFTMQLDSKPTASVTVGLSSSDTTEGTVSPSSLTFTADVAGSQTRRPTGDADDWGTWSGSWTNLTDGTDSTYILGTDTSSGAAYRMFTFNSLSLPANATNIIVTMHFSAREDGWAPVNNPNIRAALTVGGVIRVGPSHDPHESSDSFSQYADAFTTNPFTENAWLLSEINGDTSPGVAGLSEIGV